MRRLCSAVVLATAWKNAGAEETVSPASLSKFMTAAASASAANIIPAKAEEDIPAVARAATPNLQPLPPATEQLNSEPPARRELEVELPGAVEQEQVEKDTAAEDAIATMDSIPEAPPEKPHGGLLRWFWWFVIAYMFYAQATICDEYFVQAIKVMVEKFQIPEDVAGATLMALGCNGPELFTNFIAIFITHNDVGVGTIVGSEIFNLLCIVGGSIVACPKLPLELEKAPFVRDCAFYAVSILMLAWTLADGEVTTPEAVSLLVMCGVYAVTVAMTKQIVAKLYPDRPKPVLRRSITGTRVMMADGSRPSKEAIRAGMESEEVEIKVIQPARFDHGLDAREVVTLQVKPEGLAVECELQQDQQSFNFPLLSHRNETGDQTKILRFDDMVVLEETSERDAPCVLTLDNGDRVGDMLEVQMWFKDPEHQKKIIGTMKAAMPSRASIVEQGKVEAGEMHRASMAAATTWYKKLLLAVEFPLAYVLDLTMSWCDVKIPINEEKWGACFGMSMVWLAIFSYLMCSIADIIHDEFGISTGLLGITLCAVGTSFPNFYASLIMAGEGRSAMAIANALGSNIQNVFLALAVPWTLKCCVSGSYAVAANGIGIGVGWMGITLAMVAGLAVKYNCRLDAWMGWMLIATYAVYLVITIFTTN
ncbi:unnamed protein product [Amoebophrya sp. A25]|nr:unnamed protein product [Amoebophrya sp. A25]|eukprot:GSA25T00000177001.1